MSKDRIALIRGFRFSPSDPRIDERKALFDAICFYVRSRGGWVTSVPGAREVRVECLPDASIPNDLTGLGYELTEVGETKRILPTSIIQQFSRRADGELEPLTEGSTKRVAETRHHAGIALVKQYAFNIP